MKKFIKRHIISKSDLVNIKQRIVFNWKTLMYKIRTLKLSGIIYSIISSTIFQVALIIAVFFTGLKYYETAVDKTRDTSSVRTAKNTKKEVKYEYIKNSQGQDILLREKQITDNNDNNVSKKHLESMITTLETKIKREEDVIARMKASQLKNRNIKDAYKIYSRDRRQDFEPASNTKEEKTRTVKNDIKISKYNARDIKMNNIVNGDLYIRDISNYRLPTNTKVLGDIYLNNVKKFSISEGTFIEGNIIIEKDSSISPINRDEISFNGQIIL